MFCCDHELLEPFQSKRIQVPKLTRGLELADYNIKFVHIKGKNNVLTDAISSLKTLNIYEEPLENPKSTDS